jgi:hypothetical protein
MTPQSQSVVTEAQAKAKWREMAPLIDGLTRRTADRGDFLVSPGSSLAGDDRASDPYQTSHLIRLCLTAAADHLHAVKVLVVEQEMLHIAAPASLARGAIENAATAVWVLGPSQRDERVMRTLRWHSRNFRDQESAVGALGLPGHKPLRAKLDRIGEIARARGVDGEQAQQGYKISSTVAYAQHRTGTGVLFPWQICSGFAHGRPWAYLGVSQREEFPTADPQVLDLRLSNDYARSLYPALMALHLVQDLLRMFQLRSQPS